MGTSQRQLLMFDITQRLVHWLHTAAFAVLMLTGIVLYIPWFGSSVGAGDGGYVIRLLHRVGAVAFMLVPLIYVIFSPGAFFAAMKRV
ncbi:MAG: hypothetical protein PVI07_19145, partial [Anaerolineae bacterium]